MIQTENQILIIFGASGDLTKRKLIPALYDLYKQKLLPEKFAVLGASRSQLTDNEFRTRAEEFLPKDESVDSFKKMLFYQPVLTNTADDLIPLKNRLQQLSTDLQIEENYIFYLSTPPSLYGIIPRLLSENGLSKSNKFFRRLIVEKPFGTDLDSAKKLNVNLLNYFDEEQIYRIDHYLGKETVQNMLVTRFSNGIFEPLWNRNYIDRIEITSAEILEAIKDSLDAIVTSVKQVLEKTPPELSADIVDKGIVMAGGGSLIRNFAELLSKNTLLKVVVADNALESVVIGAGMALDKLAVLRKIEKAER